MKIQRPGHTESNLLLQNFLKYNYSEQYDENIEHIFIQWLYTTSGVYDKTVDLNNICSIIESQCYRRWILEYEKALCNCEHIECCFGNPSFSDKPPDVLKKYLLKFKAKSVTINFNYVYNLNPQIEYSQYWSMEYSKNNNYYGIFYNHYNYLEGKTVLVISAFSDLIEYQHKNNVKQIFKNFPTFKLITYTTPYTFMNDGPHNNFFETLDSLWYDIEKLDFDIALLSCGNYAALLADKIDTIKGKNAIYMGRGCNYMFGIDPNKDPQKYPNWITTIPNKYIPPYFDKVENGIYWKNINNV